MRCSNKVFLFFSLSLFLPCLLSLFLDLLFPREREKQVKKTFLARAFRNSVESTLEEENGVPATTYTCDFGLSILLQAKIFYGEGKKSFCEDNATRMEAVYSFLVCLPLLACRCNFNSDFTTSLWVLRAIGQFLYSDFVCNR